MAFYKLPITEIRRETPDAISVLFSVPEAYRDVYDFVAGQYLNLKLVLDGQEIRRAYSICSAPGSGELRIAIKGIRNGFFSKFANEQLRVGDVLEVGLPEGNFTFHPNAERQRNYVAFAAGSGITPVMSILQSVLEGEPESSFVLVYGNKSPETAIFYQQLHELEQRFVGRFFLHHVFSEAKVDGALFGRIDRSVVNFVLKNKHKEMTFDGYWLCGPEDMIRTVSSVLTSQNVKEKDIHFELFTSSAPEKKIDVSGTSHTKVTVLVDGDETTFEMSPLTTVLDAALKAGADAPYSCQGGICSSCMARVKSGGALMKKNAILTDGEIADGLILTCQAHPTTPELYIDYDDV
ncbi:MULTISPECIES: ferredoxin--NADP reductase [unclassified Flavobacterium]|uniref:ferredoxin--NADP reductase n=1 Tax=unclassified Flavobacterium TaxID=196869 RepID=UPI001F1332E9|nr:MULTISPECIES: ferredoxin--NADP reductase [unclassified Flavobacterium]UMY66406.1 ferredoxin--NADP reductase [Flavobacterium sp. HJ-32-4]